MQLNNQYYCETTEDTINIFKGFVDIFHIKVTTPLKRPNICTILLLRYWLE